MEAGQLARFALSVYSTRIPLTTKVRHDVMTKSPRTQRLKFETLYLQTLENTSATETRFAVIV